VTAARRRACCAPIGSRKVGTPTGRVLARARSGRPDGSVQQRETADGPGNRSQVRVKRCGKSAPAFGVTRTARQTPPGARSSRGHGRPVRPGNGAPSGRPHRWMVTDALGRHRIPLTDRLTIVTSIYPGFCSRAAPATQSQIRRSPSCPHERGPADPPTAGLAAGCSDSRRRNAVVSRVAPSRSGERAVQTTAPTRRSTRWRAMRRRRASSTVAAVHGRQSRRSSMESAPRTLATASPGS
jgi:hypothetical protein